MTLELGLCRRCGGVYDPEQVNDGYCEDCYPDPGEHQPELDMSRIVTDCE